MARIHYLSVLVTFHRSQTERADSQGPLEKCENFGARLSS